jgi:hypothetical protein
MLSAYSRSESFRIGHHTGDSASDMNLRVGEGIIAILNAPEVTIQQSPDVRFAVSYLHGASRVGG